MIPEAQDCRGLKENADDPVGLEAKASKVIKDPLVHQDLVDPRATKELRVRILGTLQPKLDFRTVCRYNASRVVSFYQSSPFDQFSNCRF